MVKTAYKIQPWVDNSTQGNESCNLIGVHQELVWALVETSMYSTVNKNIWIFLSVVTFYFRLSSVRVIAFPNKAKLYYITLFFGGAPEFNLTGKGKLKAFIIRWPNYGSGSCSGHLMYRGGWLIGVLFTGRHSLKNIQLLGFTLLYQRELKSW